MKFATLLFTTLSLFFSVAYGQEAPTTDTLPSPWKLKSTFGLNGTQSSFVNWNAGGRNNISLLGYIEAGASFEKKGWKWDNDLGLALGGLKYIDKGNTDGLQKTDDKIDLSSNIGHRIKKSWYLSLISGFKTQFLDGFNFPNDSVRISGFMIPGYVSSSLGIDYSPGENFTIFLSPISTKITIVQSQLLANAGAYGVDAATYDVTTGEVLTMGKKYRYELGAYFKFKYNATLAKNIEMKSKLELFSNYLNHPENIDVNAEVIFNFKVNSWFSASVNWNLIYDHDINIRDAKGNVGPRTQFKSVLGLGIAYTLKNFKAE
jgi:hypothetical protein